MSLTHDEKAREILKPYCHEPNNSVEDEPYIRVDSWDYIKLENAISTALKEAAEEAVVAKTAEIEHLKVDNALIRGGNEEKRKEIAKLQSQVDKYREALNRIAVPGIGSNLGSLYEAIAKEALNEV